MRPEGKDKSRIRRVAPLGQVVPPNAGFVVPRVVAVPSAVGAAVKRVPHVLECHLMAGTADSLLNVVAQMHSSFALRTVFKTTALPV